MRRPLWLAFIAALAACEQGGSGLLPSGSGDSGTGEAVTASSLDTGGSAPPAALALDMPALTADGRVDDSDATGTAVIPVEVTPAAVAAAAAEDALSAAIADAPVAKTPEELEAEKPVPEVKTEAQLRCERRGGVYASAAEGGPRTCVSRTKDGGKRCDQDRDCEGQCLARSRTCAPINPLLGCNDILQDDGATASLCLN